jgi:adenine-specific DNA-methyltransferase
MDEVFGRSGFLAQIVVNLNAKGRQLGKGFATSHEYVLAYARDPRHCVLDASSTETVDPADFPLEAADGRRYRHLPLRNTNKKFNPVTARTLHFAIWGDPESGRVSVTPFDGAQEIEPVFGDGRPAVWRWSAPLIEQRPDDLVCRLIKGRDGARVDVFQKDWLHRDTVGGRRKKLRTIWLSEEIGSTDTAVAELKQILGHVFESPKPTGLVRRILQTMPADAVVMDFFAGSGTTGHAVVLQNVADGGTRRCISVNSAEPTRPGSNAELAGYATVADITRARLRAVADAIGGGFEELGFETGARAPSSTSDGSGR